MPKISPTRPPLPPFDEASADHQGAPRRGRLEQPRPGAGGARLHGRQRSGGTAPNSSPAAMRSPRFSRANGRASSTTA